VLHDTVGVEGLPGRRGDDGGDHPRTGVGVDAARAAAAG